jgi:hypothetical protein
VVQTCYSFVLGAFQPLAHRPLVTPRASAISCCFQPFWCSSQARKRRPSRQLVAWLDKVFSMKPSLPNPRNPGISFLFRNQ